MKNSTSTSTITIGSLIEMQNGSLRVEKTPDYVRLADGESFARSIRTGAQYIVKAMGPQYRSRPDLTRVALFEVTTEVDASGERPAIFARRGRFITGVARTLKTNVVH